jgi:hypothetical protein
MTTETRTVEAAHAALSEAEAVEAAAYAEVDRLREIVAVGRAPRGDLLKAQQRLARAQTATGDAAAALRLLSREAEAASAAAAAERARAAGERAAAVRAENAALERRIGRFLDEAIWMASDLSRDVFEMKGQGGLVADLNKLASWQRVRGDLAALQQAFPVLPEPTPITTKEEIPNV